MALQGSLLPESLPVLPGLQLAAHYLVAGSEQEAGGDWFDAVPLPDGAVALVVGDVVGHGPKASVAMGQLRAVLAALLLDGHGVAETLTRLGRFVTRVPSAMATTVCLAVLDPVTGEAQYACSGHPPPLLLGADGDARYLPVHQGAPLGTSGAPPEVGKVRLDPGDVLMLFTDGLVERPDRPLPDGLDQLRGCAVDALRRGPAHMMTGPGIDRMCRLSLERMTRDGYPDDVSLIAAQRVRRVPALCLVLSALPPVLAELRAELGRWLDALGAEQRDTSAIQLAIGEAVTNTIEHAYPDGAGAVRVEGRLDPDGRVALTVTDRGRWRPPPSEPNGRGRGLIMIRASMDTAEVEATPGGTVVTMSRQLHRAPVVAPGQQLPARPVGVVAEPPFAVRASRGPQPMLEVTGPVDAHSVTEFRRRLADACRGGTLPLDLDLTGVTHLGSVGVLALHELAGQMAAERRPLRMIAPALCPAYAVLELTGLTQLVAPTAAPPEDDGLGTGVA
jgi:anti-sigma regulatory factor (Ser/Thr protein kinase)/anti-anti-sigma regulatory factor